MAILACRTGTPARLIPETFGPRKINVPMAPALGLLLEQVGLQVPTAHPAETKRWLPRSDVGIRSLPARLPDVQRSRHQGKCGAAAEGKPDRRGSRSQAPAADRVRGASAADRRVQDAVHLREDARGGEGEEHVGLLDAFACLAFRLKRLSRLFSFDRWLRYVDAYDGDDLLYLNPRGLIPPAAVFGKKGERRAKLLRCVPVLSTCDVCTQ